MYFLMSVGSIFIVMYPTEDGAVEHLILGLLLIAIAIVILVLNRKNKKLK